MKKIKAFIFILLIGSIILCLTSCKETNIESVYEEGDFRFALVKGSSDYTIIGLTEEGKTKETLVLPTMVNGKKVTALGYLGGNQINGTKPTIDFDGTICKNFYVHALIKECENSVGNIIFSKLYYASFFYPSFLERNARGILCSPSSHTGYICEKCKIDALKENPNDYYSKYYKSVNVIYYMNDDTEEVFFVDDCDGTKVNVIPPNPYREGYEFKGWYKEKECITLFDFENDVIPNKEYDEEENYILKENNIYAKWEVLK